MEVLYDAGKGRMYQVTTLDLALSDSITLSFEENLDDFRDFLKITGCKEPEIKSPYTNVMNSLSLSYYDLLRIIPKEKLKILIDEQLQKLRIALSNPSNQIYVQSYLKQKKFLRSLYKPTIDKEIIEKLAADITHPHIAEKVKSLGKTKDKTVYTMAGTATGRLTVTHGPNILTLPSLVRKAIKPQGNNKVLQIDLTAAEPHLALLVAEKEIPDDIYDHIAREVLNNEVTRKHAKLITLSALYGQSAGNLSKTLPDSVNARHVISKTKEFFNIEKTYKNLKSNLRDNNLRNLFGRPLCLDRERSDLVISHYLQSSVAEASILLFSDFCAKLENVVKPYYVIHDALIFECQKKQANMLLAQEKIKLCLGSWVFQAKITEV